MGAYRTTGCSEGRYTAIQLTANADADSANNLLTDCSIGLDDILPSWQVQLARWTGIALAALFLLASLHKLSKLTRPKLTQSIPAQAHLLIAWYDVAILLQFVDPVRVQKLYPDEFDFVLRWMIDSTLLSLLVVASWGILDGVFRKLDRRNESWMGARHIQLLFLFVLTFTFMALFPTSSGKVRGGQRLVLVFEIVVLGAFGLVNGYKMHKLLMTHLKMFGGEDYKRAIFKTRVLIAVMVVAITVACVMTGQRATEYFNEDEVEDDRVFSKEDLERRFWFALSFPFFVIILVNALSVVLFNGKSSSSQKNSNEAQQKKADSKGQSEIPESVPTAIPLQCV